MRAKSALVTQRLVIWMPVNRDVMNLNEKSATTKGVEKSSPARFATINPQDEQVPARFVERFRCGQRNPRQAGKTIEVRCRDFSTASDKGGEPAQLRCPKRGLNISQPVVESEFVLFVPPRAAVGLKLLGPSFDPMRPESTARFGRFKSAIIAGRGRLSNQFPFFTIDFW